MRKKRIEWTMGLLMATALTTKAGDIKGIIMDKEMNEPLMGASVRLQGTRIGATADMNGIVRLRGLKKGTYVLEVSYVSFFPKKVTINVPARGEVSITVDMEPDDKQLNEVTVTARKNLELERALLAERQNATLSIENLGASEMSIKGISNVQDGVKKLTGISIAEAGQLVVRGLGDRYSTTTLNGLPIASPNPDNKLIPLDIFPSSAVQNITVSKVFEAGAFADYSGAHVDIITKEGGSKDFFSISAGVGGTIGTVGQDFYRMDHDKTIFRTPTMDKHALNTTTNSYQDFLDLEEYSRKNNIFNTTFETTKTTAMPDLSGSMSYGHLFKLGGNRKLDFLASLGIKNDYESLDDAFIRTYEASGNQLSDYTYDRYSNIMKLAGLLNTGYMFRKSDRIGFTAFYARNAVDSYMLREGVDSESHLLTGSNQTTHVYSLQNYQLSGHHNFNKWDLDWSGSYSITSSDEPDRRQVMFERQSEDAPLELFKLNQQETMRYFGALNEDEWVGSMHSTYRFGDKNKVHGGVAYKDKGRDYEATRFYYRFNGFNPTINDPYHTDDYLNFENIQNGSISIDRSKLKRNNYSAGNQIVAGFLETDYYPVKPLLINVGLRFEGSKQWVNYFDDGGAPERRDMNTNDFFPALNMKYELNKKQSIRFAASRTVTRPSFIEMAPFLYQESYGSSQIRGNADLKNGYNYNVDLRYEFFRPSSTDMIAVTAYYKFLDSPIERIQSLAGGAVINSFENATSGMAAGIEIEARKELAKDLKAGVNASFMYTNVKLVEGGAYTNPERALQGASPYLVNADITYSPKFQKERQLSLALLYNLQGKRIQSVGVSGIGDVEQQSIHTLDFIGTMRFGNHWSTKLQVKNILNRDVVFMQDIPMTGQNVEVERFNEGMSLDLGVTYNF